MFKLLVLISRYVFIFCIVYFLWQALVCLLDERGIMRADGELACSKQRIMIIFMHITAFLILAYLPATMSFDRDIMLLGAGGLIFFILSFVLFGVLYRRGCSLLWNGMFFLLDTGLITIARLQRIQRLSALGLPRRQLLWFFVGAVCVLVLPFILKIISKFEKLGFVYILAAYIFLLSPFVIGVEQGGAINWVSFRGITFQPSEIAKFLYTFYLASAFRKKPDMRQVFLPTVLSVGVVLILVLQTDLGGALIFFMTFMVMLYIATGSNFLFMLGMGAAFAAAYIAHQLFGHVQTRVAAWQNPWQDIDSGGYQIIQSLFAIGTFGLLGSGLTLGAPGLVPVVESDFIFAAICEEFGSLFGMGIIGIFLMIFYRGVHISLRTAGRYYALLAAGFTSMLAFQTFLILGGVIKLIPMTGVTLPFVSYGGSSIVVSILMIGILQWIFMREAN